MTTRYYYEEFNKISEEVNDKTKKRFLSATTIAIGFVFGMGTIHQTNYDLPKETHAVSIIDSTSSPQFDRNILIEINHINNLLRISHHTKNKFIFSEIETRLNNIEARCTLENVTLGSHVSKELDILKSNVNKALSQNNQDLSI
jgi:hypothetical protein